jgi:sugar phosphate isomerase/epimerase
MRGFAFYHPRGESPYDYVDQVVDQLGDIAELCDRNGLTFGLEVEANLVGQCGPTLELLHKKVNHPAMLTIFDAANIVTQGYSSAHSEQDQIGIRQLWPAVDSGRSLQAGGDTCRR